MTTTTFHQTEVPVFLEPEFFTQLRGGYDTSQVFSRDFLEAHTIPSLPTSQLFRQTFNSQLAASVGRPKSPSGATFEPEPLPQEAKDYLYACSLIGPVYEHIFDSHDPEESSNKQVAELEMILRAAKDELKVAYHKAVRTRTREHYAAIQLKREKKRSKKRDKKQSRWEEEGEIPSDTKAVLESSVRDGCRVGGMHMKKETIYNKVGGTLLTFQ